MEPIRPGEGSRLDALDGLRGFLATMVVFHHCMITVVAPPSFAADPLFWVAVFSPVHLAWAGTQAVYAFFVLSGFVLMWPHREAIRTQWVPWYVQRLTRLYLPIWAGAVFSYGVYLCVPRPVRAGMSDWLLLHVGPYSPGDFARDLSLIRYTDPILNTAYWSLRWEVVYSLLVPLVVAGLLQVRSRFGAFALAVLLLGLIVLGADSSGQLRQWDTLRDALIYLPMFFLGALAAQRAAQIRQLIHRAERSRGAITALWVGAIAALLWPLQWQTAGLLRSLHQAIAAWGALLLVILFAFSSSGRRIGQMRVPAWLGERSFSIYLVHGPIVISMAYFLYPGGLPWVMLVTAAPLAIGVGALFFACVERPLHAVSRDLGGYVRKRLCAGGQKAVSPPRALNGPSLSPTACEPGIATAPETVGTCLESGDRKSAASRPAAPGYA